MGRWLVAMVFGKRDGLRHQRVQMPKGPLRGDDAAVLEQAGTLALKRYFGRDYDLEAVTTFAAAVRDCWKLPSGAGLMTWRRSCASLSANATST
jgi:hypothetical protein